jgi:DNA-binding response OmpR family regulator
MTRTRRVLLVGSCAQLASRLAPLQRASVEVCSAPDAARALELHRTARADLIVSDLDLPDSTAERLCETLRGSETLRNVSILVVCGPGDEQARRAAACRANGHVVRPVDVTVLTERIRRLMLVSSRAPYRVLTEVNAGGRSFFCRSENVSPVGMLIETTEPLSVGQSLGCAFYLPGRLKLVARGSVVRQANSPAGRHFGIEFVELSQGDAAALARFVERWGTLR